MSQSGMVSQHKDPVQYMSVRYNDFLAPIIRAIQELSEENERLKTEIKRIDALESSLASIKTMLSGPPVTEDK